MRTRLGKHKVTCTGHRGGTTLIRLSTQECPISLSVPLFRFPLGGSGTRGLLKCESATESLCSGSEGSVGGY